MYVLLVERTETGVSIVERTVTETGVSVFSYKERCLRV